MDFIGIFRALERLRADLNRLRRGLIRIGSVDSVNVDAGTVIVVYPDPDTTGQPVKSLAMPWLQRSTEHRPPAVGDHALVLDPSLGGRGALAICGWPSTAKPPSGGGGAKDVIFRQRGGSDTDTYDAGTRTIKASHIVADSSDVKLGVSPTDYVALAPKVDAEIARIWSVLNGTYVPAPSSAGPADAGEPGLITFQGLASTAASAVQSVAGSQVKAK